MSVSIPSYNHAPFLPAAIESVLGQTYPCVELVVVEDGSADGSLEVARRYEVAHPGRVRVVTHAEGHLGVNATANRGIREARGVYWGGLPSDDVLCPDKVERQVALLEADPALVYAYGYSTTIDRSGRAVPGGWRLGEDLSTHPRPLERLLQVNCVPGVTALVRLEALHRFAPELHRELVYSDWDLWIRLAAHGRVGFVPRTVAYSRGHDASTRWAAVRPHEELDIEVLESLRAHATEVGGALARPASLAVLELELARRRHALGRLEEAEADLAAAFSADPGLVAQPARLWGWLVGQANLATPPLSRDEHVEVANAVLQGLPYRSAGEPGVAAWAFARFPAGVRAALARRFAALELAHAAFAAEREGEFRAARRLALRSVFASRVPLANKAFRRLLVRLAVGRHLARLLRAGRDVADRRKGIARG